jgi:glycosyltransferase involved in cell wall biosynthesis
MRISFGLTDPKLSGGVRAAEEPFIKEFERLPDASIVVFEFGRRIEDHSTIERLYSLFKDLLDFALMLRRRNPDVVHLNSSFTHRALLRDFAYVIIASLSRTRLFIKYHGSDSKCVFATNIFWALLGQICVRSTVGVGVLSSEEKKAFERAGHPPNKVWQVKNVVNTSTFKQSSRATNCVSQLLFISRFVPTKGLLDAIEATHQIARTRPDITLVCVGDGPDRPRAEELVSRLALGGRVQFTGQIREEEARQFYESSAILVFPTFHDEGFSMALFQSVAAGLPVVTTKIRAAADFLKEPANCLWVQPHNPSDIVEKVIYLLDRPDLMKRMSLNNRSLAEQFAPKTVVQEYLQLYERFCDRRSVK